MYLVQPQPVFVDQRPDVKTKPPFLTAVVGAGRQRTPLYDLEMVDTIYFYEPVTTQLFHGQYRSLILRCLIPSVLFLTASSLNRRNFDPYVEVLSVNLLVGPHDYEHDY